MIPALSVVLNPAELAKHLHLFALPPWNWGRVTQVEVLPLKTSHQNRQTLEIIVHTLNGPHRMVGKVDARDRSDVYRAMKAIARAGFGPDAEYSIPHPLAFVS